MAGRAKLHTNQIEWLRDIMSVNIQYKGYLYLLHTHPTHTNTNILGLSYSGHCMHLFMMKVISRLYYLFSKWINKND